MTTVLILSTDEVISSLLAQLTELSGNTPKYRAADESLIVSINRIQPGVVLLDARFGIQKLETAMAAAEDECSAVILFGGSYSSSELKGLAMKLRIPYLPLPTDLRVFRLLIQQAAGLKPEGIHPAIISALDSVSRTRGLVEQMESICEANRSFPNVLPTTYHKLSQREEHLREGVVEYAKKLRLEGVSKERAVTLIENAVIVGKFGASDAGQLRQEMDSAARWCTEEYHLA